MMNKYQDIYDSKKVTVDEVLENINSGDEIATACCAMEPFTILGSLHKIADKVENVKVLYSLGLGKPRFMLDPTYNDKFDVISFFYMDSARKAHKYGGISYQPCDLHNAVRRRLDYAKPNIFIGSATPMDEHGYMRISLSLVCEKELIENADIVILEINPNLPVVGGETEIHISEVDYLVEVNTPIPELPDYKLTDVDKKIGEYVASLVDDGDTIQLGIGSIPDAVAQAFTNKKDIGVHTEMITNSIADLVESGVITNRRKTLHKGKIIGAFALGNEKLYKFLDNNPSVMIMRASYVNNPYIIAKNDNMVSINSAIQVDLTGQVCSESFGTLQYSGSGGLNDTVEGAIHSKGGKSIIVLKSTAKHGAISTIQSILTPGSVVTLSRNNVDYVVTEYGIAPLKGRTIKERVENLISIAHPNFRHELRVSYEKNYI